MTAFIRRHIKIYHKKYIQSSATPGRHHAGANQRLTTALVVFGPENFTFTLFDNLRQPSDYLQSESLNNLLFNECQEKIDLPLIQVPVIFFIKKIHEFHQETVRKIETRLYGEKDR